MADPRSTLLFLLIITYFIFANDSSAQLRDNIGRAAAQNAIDEARVLLDIVGNSSYGQIDHILDYTPINSNESSLGGFRHARNYAWAALPKVQQRAKEQLAYALGDSSTAALQGTRDGTVTAPLFYTNITGESRGRWIRSGVFEDADIPKLNLSDYTVQGPFGDIKHSRFDRNFTGIAGDARLSLRERELSKELPSYASLNGNITAITAYLTLSEDNTEQEEDIPLRGVHFTHLGQSILTTTSTKYAGIFALPLFALSSSTFSMSQILLNETITSMLAQSDNNGLNAANPWTAEAPSTQQQQVSPKCELIVYLQHMPVAATSSSLPLSIYDKELRFPTGAPLPDAPKMTFAMLAFSPDCGFILESEGPPDASREHANHLSGYKGEILKSRARYHVLFLGAVATLQLTFLTRQMREASTPSTRSRISFYTISMMVFVDSFQTIILATASLIFDTIWISVLGGATIALLIVNICGMQFLSEIWAVHAPERRRREQEVIEESRRQLDAAMVLARERQQASYDDSQSEAEVPAAPVTESPASALPAAPTQQVVDFGSLPVFMPSDQAGLQPINPRATAAEIAHSRVPTFGALYMRWLFLLMIILFLSVSASTFPSTLRRLYFVSLAFGSVSIWIPQILRNVQRNCRKALRWEFVVSQSVLRLVPIAYFYAWEDNVFFTQPQRSVLVVLSAWVWIQVIVLASQEIVGARWFVKKAWVPAAWDYHPILRSDLEGTSLPLGLADSISLPTSPSVERQEGKRESSAKDSKHDGKRVFDCAICMQDLEVPVVDSGDSGEIHAAVSGSLMLARRTYMVTPCRHIFHTNCLEGWMKYRLQCPICREGLPPL